MTTKIKGQLAGAGVKKTLASVTDMQEARWITSELSGDVIETHNNDGNPLVQSWRVVTSEPTEGYWVESTVSSNIWFTLEIGEVLNLSELGWTPSGKTSAEIAAIIELGCTVARRTPQLNEIHFPSGSYDVDRFEIDIDRRGFKILGAGQDKTILTSKSVSDVSMLVTRVDPRDRARDRFHDYLTIGEFTINGDIAARDASCATKAVVQPNYTRNTIKSVGHRVSNMDVNGLVVDYEGHTEGRAGSTVYSLHSLRLRNNSINCAGKAYTNGDETNSSSRALTCDDGASVTTSAISVNDTQIQVASATGLEQYDRVEIGDSPDVIEVRWVVAKSGTTLTLDSALTVARSAGATVKIPVVSNSFRGTIEAGRVDLNNPVGFVMDATYQEESRILLTGYHKQTVIRGVSNVEVSPSITIDQLDKRSHVEISNNNTGFSVAMNLMNRGGAVDSQLDLYNMPTIKIDSNTRAENAILINSIAFESIDVKRNYDTDIGDNYQTDFEFTGNYLGVDAGTTVTGLEFYLDAPAGINYDGITLDLHMDCRRSGASNVRSGVFKRVGGVSTDGVANTNDTVNLVTSYAYSADAGNAVNIFFSGDAGRATVRYVGETAGGSRTKFITSGKISQLR